MPSLERAAVSWGWLLTELGYSPYQEWPAGRSWRLGDTYVVVERSPDLSSDVHDRRQPGLNHLAFHAASAAEVESLVADAPRHGWRSCSPTGTHTPARRHQHAAHLEDRTLPRSSWSRRSEQGQWPAWPAGMLPRMIARRTSLLCVALVLALGALTGCRQAPLDPSYPVPGPHETPAAAPLRVDFTVPAGWIEAYDYSTGNDLHPAPHATFMIPISARQDDANLEVLVVVSYLMDSDVTGQSDAELIQRVKGYATQVKSAVTEPVKTTVSGMTAFRMPIKEPTRSGGFYTYDATYLFSGQHLVQIMCQWDKQKSAVESACASLLSSTKVVVP